MCRLCRTAGQLKAVEALLGLNVKRSPFLLQQAYLLMLMLNCTCMKLSPHCDIIPLYYSGIILCCL